LNKNSAANVPETNGFGTVAKSLNFNLKYAQKVFQNLYQQDLFQKSYGYLILARTHLF
jgi:hypothetical protein